MSDDSPSKKPMESAIKAKLTCYFSPVYLKIVNESQMYNLPEGTETHFKVFIVSDRFQNVPLLERHRLINEVLHHELHHGIKSFSVIARTSDQWTEDDEVVPSTRFYKDDDDDE